MSSGGLFPSFYGTVQWGDMIYDEKIKIPNELTHAKLKTDGYGAASRLMCSQSTIKHTRVETLQRAWFIFANRLMQLGTVKAGYEKVACCMANNAHLISASLSCTAPKDAVQDYRTHYSFFSTQLLVHLRSLEECLLKKFI